MTSRPSIDLNADLGEGGPSDAELLDVVTSASVACGFHAGDPLTMLRTARAAAERGVSVGAHPSYRDRKGFGRRSMSPAPEDLFACMVHQIGAMAAAATAAGTGIRYVKPHGALYNQASADPSVAQPVVEAVAVSGLPLLCPHGSAMHHLADSRGVRCYFEAFADRAYSPDGALAGRQTPGAVLLEPAEVADRALALASTGEIRATDGTLLRLRADSLCLHGDTPGALAMARAVRAALQAAGVDLLPFTGN